MQPGLKKYIDERERSKQAAEDIASEYIDGDDDEDY